MSSEHPPAAPSAAATLETLRRAFPVIREAKPLALGIHKALQDRLPDLAKAALKGALRNHTSSTRYLKALSQASERYDLDGNPSGEVTEEQRQQALVVLKERFRKEADRRREAQAAEQTRRKLEQLVARFNHR